MPDTKLTLRALKEHLRKFVWIYIIGIALCLVGTSLLWTTTAPQPGIDEKVTIYLSDIGSNPEPLQPIAEHMLEQTRPLDEKLQLVERLQGEKQQVEQQLKELQNRLSQVRPVPAPSALSHKWGVAVGTDQREDSFRYCWIRVLRDRGWDQVFLPAGLIGLLSVCFIPKQDVLQCGLFEFCVHILTA